MSISSIPTRRTLRENCWTRSEEPTMALVIVPVGGVLLVLEPSQTVPYWVRVTLATRGATTAQEWHQLFYKYNSGTYNNRTLRALVSNHGRAAPALAMSMR